MKDGAIKEGQTWRHETKGDFEIGPCEDGYHVLLGGRHEWQVDDNYLRAHFTLVSDPDFAAPCAANGTRCEVCKTATATDRVADTRGMLRAVCDGCDLVSTDTPAPVPADAAEVARLRDTLAAAQATLAGIRSALRCPGSVGLVEWAAKIREDLDAAEMTVVEGTEILSEARAALNCGLTAEQRNALTLCRLLGADCAACRLARRDIAVADLRVRLRGAEQQIDKRDADAAKIRAALGCRDGETTLAVAKRVPDLIRSLTADKAQLAADVVETRTQRIPAQWGRRGVHHRCQGAGGATWMTSTSPPKRTRGARKTPPIAGSGTPANGAR